MFETTQFTTLSLSFLVGMLVGGLYFGTLWLTVRRMPSATAPFSMYFGSLAARLAILLASFLILLKFAGPVALVTAVVGFVGARIALTRCGSHQESRREMHTTESLDEFHHQNAAHTLASAPADTNCGRRSSDG